MQEIQKHLLMYSENISVKTVFKIWGCCGCSSVKQDEAPREERGGSHHAPWSLQYSPPLNCSALGSVQPDGPPLHLPVLPQRKSRKRRPPQWLLMKMRVHAWRHPLWPRSLHCGYLQYVWTGCAGCRLLACWSRRSSESGACGSDSPCPATCPVSTDGRRTEDTYTGRRKHTQWEREKDSGTWEIVCCLHFLFVLFVSAETDV